MLSTATPSVTERRHQVLIVGGGPAGAAIAKCLADTNNNYRSSSSNGFGPVMDVHLYEAYPHPAEHREGIVRKVSPTAHSISLHPRGQQSLCHILRIGNSEKDIQSNALKLLEQYFTENDQVKLSGFCFSNYIARHPATKATYRPVPSITFPRQGLAAFLLREAEKSGAQIHVLHRLQDLDLDQRIATFAVTENLSNNDNVNTTSTTIKHMSYDLLIAADGSKSIVREILSQRVPSFHVRTEQDDVEYQIVAIPHPFMSEDTNNSGTGGSDISREVDFPPETLHTWNNRNDKSVCFSFPLVKEKILRLLIAFPEGKLESFRNTYINNNDASAYIEALKGLFPNLDPSLFVDISDQLSRAKIGTGGLCVWTSALGSPQHGVLLLGDAGHGMWPSLGQGANCALESVVVCHKAVVEQTTSNDGSFTSSNNNRKADIQPSWSDQIVRLFDQRRRIDALAAVDLSFAGMGQRQSRLLRNAPYYYTLRMTWISCLNRWTGGWIPPPAIQQLLDNHVRTYSSIIRFGRYYENWLTIGPVVCVLSAIPFFWLRQRSTVRAT